MEDDIIKLGELLKANRAKWQTEILKIITMSKDERKIAEASIVALSYRHKFIDDLAKYSDFLSNTAEQLSQYRKERLFYYYKPKNDDIRMQNAPDRNIAIAADISPIQRKIDLIKSHIDFLKNCIGTMDKFGYFVKSKIELDKLGI